MCLSMAGVPVRFHGGAVCAVRAQVRSLRYRRFSAAVTSGLVRGGGGDVLRADPPPACSGTRCGLRRCRLEAGAIGAAGGCRGRGRAAATSCCSAACSLTWSSVAEAIPALLALALSASIVALMVSISPAADDAWQCLAHPHAHGIAQGVPSCWPHHWHSICPANRRAPGQALHPVLWQRQRPQASCWCLSWWRPDRRLALCCRSGDARRLRGARSLGWAVLVAGSCSHAARRRRLLAR